MGENGSMPSCPSCGAENPEASRFCGACGTTCADVANDPANCGDCGNPCPAVANGTPACASGVCGAACNPGYTDCNGACVELASDHDHCTACNIACKADEVCSVGGCTTSCCRRTART